MKKYAAVLTCAFVVLVYGIGSASADDTRFARGDVLAVPEPDATAGWVDHCVEIGTGEQRKVRS